MAKFRQNHARGSKGALGIVKILLFVLILGGVLYYLSQSLQNIQFTNENVIYDYTLSSDEIRDSLYFIPASSRGQIIHHKYYSLSYVEEYEQAEWVAYELTKESIRKPNVPRAKRFEKDPYVSTGSADYYDYRGSGYSRGHLAPAGDMAFSKESMAESFYMSNMSPQVSTFNGGVWNELENLVRDWAYKNGRVFIVTGPILDMGISKKIGKSNVGVPKFFYKAILDIDEPQQKAIGFILPNEKSEKRIDHYAVSIDEIEEKTGLNLYEFLLDEKKQEELESTYDINLWPTDESLYNQRIKHWNNRK